MRDAKQTSSKARLRRGPENDYSTYDRLKVPTGCILLNIKGEQQRRCEQPTFIRLNSGDLLQVFPVRNYPFKASMDLDGNEFGRGTMKRLDREQLARAEQIIHRVIQKAQMQARQLTGPAPLIRFTPRTTILEFQLSPGSFIAPVVAQSEKAARLSLCGMLHQPLVARSRSEGTARRVAAQPHFELNVFRQIFRYAHSSAPAGVRKRKREECDLDGEQRAAATPLPGQS